MWAVETYLVDEKHHRLALGVLSKKWSARCSQKFFAGRVLVIDNNISMPPGDPRSRASCGACWIYHTTPPTTSHKGKIKGFWAVLKVKTMDFELFRRFWREFSKFSYFFHDYGFVMLLVFKNISKSFQKSFFMFVTPKMTLLCVKTQKTIFFQNPIFGAQIPLKFLTTSYTIWHSFFQSLMISSLKM